MSIDARRCARLVYLAASEPSSCTPERTHIIDMTARCALVTMSRYSCCSHASQSARVVYLAASEPSSCNPEGTESADMPATCALGVNWLLLSLQAEPLKGQTVLTCRPKGIGGQRAGTLAAWMQAILPGWYTSLRFALQAVLLRTTRQCVKPVCYACCNL